MQHRLGAVDVFDETLDTTGKREVLLLAGPFVDQTDPHAIVQKRQLAQSLGQDVVVVFDVLEDLAVGKKMDFGSPLVGFADDLHRRNLDSVLDLELAVHRLALMELHDVLLAVTANRQLQPVRQRVDAGHTDTVKATGDLVAVLVELAAGMQDAHDDFRRSPLRFVLVVEFDADRDTTTVIAHRDRIVGVNGHDDIVAVASQCLVDGIIDNLEHHVMQTGAVGGVADIHSGPLADGFKSLELLNAGFVVSRG